MFSLRSCNRFLIFLLIPLMISCKGKTDETRTSEPAVSAEESPDQKATPGDMEESAEAEEPSGSSVLKYKPPSDPAKEQAMQEAALNGDLAMVSRMITEGTDVNATDQEGRSALMYASFNGHIEVVRKLIESGAMVGIRDGVGRTALLYASTGPFPETVRLLLENNADPNIVDADEHFSPIMHAAAEGQLEVVRILLEYGADPSLKDVDGETAYIFAVHNGHTEVAGLLKGK